MRLIDYWHIARRRWMIIVAITLLCPLAIVGYSASQPTTYQSSSRVYVTMATGTSVNDVYQGGLAAQQRVTSYVNLVNSSIVAQRVIDSLSLPLTVGELQSKIHASFPPATALLDINVTDSTAEGAKLLTDAVVAELKTLVGQLETIQADAAPAARVSVVDPAATPITSTGPSTTRLLALGLLTGLVLGCVAALVRDRTDRRLSTSNQLEDVLPVPVLAIVDVGEPGAIGEVRRLRARLSRAMGDIRGMTTMLTSFSARSQPDIAVDLSKSFADTGRQVVVIDADTSGHGISEHLCMETDPGLAELLRTTSSPIEALSTCSIPGISVLCLGSADDQTCDLLASDRFAEILTILRGTFDHVFIGTAPIAAAAGALSVSALCDATVAVVELGNTTSPEVMGALSTFEQGGSGLIGVVAVSRRSSKWFSKGFRRSESGQRAAHKIADTHHESVVSDDQESVDTFPANR
ncbi:Wzz/FepE/Etk N-terminal domain-containing protein [Rhodococcus sp. H36-A4]|uniref:Wzz/FepE/Etk N-terminal domain-containing protein n=1 Tax=Rhodococcus sp. H36-A4 TaxID=3004353 RepID=UPI0022B011FC|nr:Wzz/FepE/Etk N-terminal domain-containing protein [Rhodococcus sp. H36-A4]MCZ4078937.1 Wzz/FepE/Etk N-terminal domain-containing protein [Rhodococcus sp. H36-A4]